MRRAGEGPILRAVRVALEIGLVLAVVGAMLIGLVVTVGLHP